MSAFVHIELRAKNDTNGNPRRLSLLTATIPSSSGDHSEIVAVYDHGYSGRPRNWPYSAFSVDVSATEYKYYKCFKPLHARIESVAKLLTTPIPGPHGKEVEA